MAKPAPRSAEELLVWAASIVRREQDNGTYGTVVIHLEKGTITRVQTQKNELPTFTSGD